MKFVNIRSIKTFLKEYGMKPGVATPVGQQPGMSPTLNKIKKQKNKASQSKMIVKKGPKPTEKPIKDMKPDTSIIDKEGNKLGNVVSPVGDKFNPDAMVVQDPSTKAYSVIDAKQKVLVDPEVDEGKLGKLAKKQNKKLKTKDTKSRLKKLSRRKLKEADPKLFEINFNRKEVAQQGLEAPVKCGFEAETFFYNVSESNSAHIDDMSVSDVEYEFGDLFDSMYEDYREAVREKAMDEYLPDLIDQWIEDNRDEDYYIDEFMDSGDGPTMDAVEEYREQMKDDDPKEFQNREEDGWDMDNWARDFINLEYDYEYQDFLREYASEDDTLIDEAVDECEGDWSMDEWIQDNWSYMSSFLDDYGFEYSTSGSVEGAADELHNWSRNNSSYDDYPDFGEYGETNNPTGWSVETDSSIDADEGAAAEVISPVFGSPKEMLKEMKSLFDWGEENFGTNNTTGLHITMSWNGKGNAPNKLKMALLLGDEYLLNEWGRLRNSYTKSQYKNVLRYAEEMKRGDNDSFLKLTSELEKGISNDKFSSIHFKGVKDRETGNQLIEFRIAGGEDYQNMYEKVVKTVVRYGTIMKAGYEPDAFKRDYVNAVYRLINKSQEPDVKSAEGRLDNISDPVIDAAKEIVGKKDYFDVLQALELSLGHLQRFKELSDPEADKRWKQSIKKYEKGTGVKLDIVEVEEREPIVGYIEPDRIAPSKQAPESLEKAQLTFGKAIAILARNIVDGQSRTTPKSKHISAFRKYAKLIDLSIEGLEKVLVSNLDNANYYGNDKEKVTMLQKGVESLFKQDVIQSKDYFDPQNFDPIADSLWQFFQSEDVNDNKIMDELAGLFQEVNPKITKDGILTTLKELSQKRQKNSMYRYLKDAGYGVEHSLITPYMLSNKGSIEKLKSFLQKYDGYEHPTSRDHHINIRSDDSYHKVFQMNLVQKMRTRLNDLNTLHNQDPEKSKEVRKKLLKIGIEFVEELKPDDDIELKQGEEDLGVVDGFDFLASDNRAENWNNRLDRLVRMQSETDEDDQTYNFVPSYDDYVISSINLDRFYDRKNDYGIPKDNYLKSLIKNRFKAIKKFLSAYDKIFQSQGFANMAKEIEGKNTLDKRNKDFEKNVRDKTKATLNIPGHSMIFIKDFNYFLNNLREIDLNDPETEMYEWFHNTIIPIIKDGINTRDFIWIIPSAHYGQAEDALSGLDLIDTFESANNYYHSWRKTGYNKILSKFQRTYNVSFKDLVTDEDYRVSTSSLIDELKNLNVDVTRRGDSRAGAPGQNYLIDPEDLENKLSGEPINRGSAMMWDQTDDKEKEEKRFNAFDWSVYPDEMKPLVAKDLKGMKEREGYYSFKQALENVLKQVADGDLEIALKNIDNKTGIIYAAGVEDYKDKSSNEVANATNWSNLADYIGIERGVNDQGVMLLKRVYDRYDSDHNWRPEDPRAIGTERWGAAVKAAYEYIKDGYNVSAGNYFRKNRDGSDGDDVSSIYSKQRDDDSGFDVTTDDYEKVREKYRMFNAMMQNGIQYYIMQPDVNRLVGFLQNEQNDELFKQAVLNRLIRDQENGEDPNDFQGALARARVDMQSRRESIFDKFDKLPLEEQLELLEKIDNNKIEEAWSKKYKNSINCSNPKGFSQKAHCAGKKKTKENNYDNPSNDELDIEQKKADEIYWQRYADNFDKIKKQKAGLPHAMKKPYHFVNPHNGKVSGEGPLAGMQLSNFPGSDHKRLTALGFRKAVNGSYFINNKVLDQLQKNNFQSLNESPTLPPSISGPDNELSIDQLQQKIDYLKFELSNLREPSKSLLATPVERAYARYYDDMALSLKNAEREQEKRRRPTPQYAYFDRRHFLPPGSGIPAGQMVEPLNTQKYTSDYLVKLGWKKKGANFYIGIPALQRLVNQGTMRLTTDGMNWYNSRYGNIFDPAPGSVSRSSELDRQKDYELGKPVRKDDEVQGNTRFDFKEGAVPDNSKIKVINKLLSDKFPANDIKKQMDAYFAIPDPSMLYDFRQHRAEGGDDVCLRKVLRHYVKTQLHPKALKKINLNENKKDLLQKIQNLPDDEQTNKLVQYIEQLLMDMGLGGRIASLTTDLEQIEDVDVKRSVRKIAKIVASIEMSPEERAKLFVDWKADNIVDVKKLTSTGTYEFNEIFPGYGDSNNEWFTELIDDLSDVVDYGVGAGEFLLAVLSPRIRGIGSGEGSGDLIVDSVNVEVKTKSKEDARFVDEHVRPDSNWQPLTDKFYKTFEDIDEVATRPNTGINTSRLIGMLQNPKLTPERKQEALKQIKSMLTSILTGLDASNINDLMSTLSSGNNVEFNKKYGAYNILNYLNIKRGRGELDGILFINKPRKKMSYMKDLSDYDNLDIKVNTIYIYSNNVRYPFPQIGLK